MTLEGLAEAKRRAEQAERISEIEQYVKEQTPELEPVELHPEGFISDNADRLKDRLKCRLGNYLTHEAFRIAKSDERDMATPEDIMKAYHGLIKRLKLGNY